MNTAIRRWRCWMLAVGLSHASVSWCGLAAQAADQASSRGVAQGTYSIVFCRGACSGTDSSAVIASGYLILSQRPIPLTAFPRQNRAYLRFLYHSIARKPEPDACFVVKQRSADGAVAAGQPAGFTNWIGDQNSIEVPFFRAPDSGYTLYLNVTGDSARGFGEFWWANDARPGVQRDSVFARRIGPPAPELCIIAAKRWRVNDQP